MVGGQHPKYSVLRSFLRQDWLPTPFLCSKWTSWGKSHTMRSYCSTSQWQSLAWAFHDKFSSSTLCWWAGCSPIPLSTQGIQSWRKHTKSQVSYSLMLLAIISILCNGCHPQRAQEPMKWAGGNTASSGSTIHRKGSAEGRVSSTQAHSFPDQQVRASPNSPRSTSSLVHTA